MPCPCRRRTSSATEVPSDVSAARSMSYIATSTPASTFPSSCHCQLRPRAGLQMVRCAARTLAVGAGATRRSDCAEVPRSASPQALSTLTASVTNTMRAAKMRICRAQRLPCLCRILPLLTLCMQLSSDRRSQQGRLAVVDVKMAQPMGWNVLPRLRHPPQYAILAVIARIMSVSADSYSH